MTVSKKTIKASTLEELGRLAIAASRAGDHYHKTWLKTLSDTYSEQEYQAATSQMLGAKRMLAQAVANYEFNTVLSRMQGSGKKKNPPPVRL